MEVLADKTAKHIIKAPVEKINLSQWLFTLKDNEYQACSTAHIAAGTSEYIDGKRMSLNVEKIAENLMVQHYVEDISDRDHCRVDSISDSYMQNEHSKIGVTWELMVTKVAEASCEFSNLVGRQIN